MITATRHAMSVAFGTMLLLVTSAPASAQNRAADKLTFTLQDANGREVQSQDYVGTPVLIEFGACW